jgi:sec-independent protein translocase protein TatC
VSVNPGAALAGVDHEVRLSLVDHLGELRARLLVSGVALLLAFGLAFWQNHALLNVLNRPLQRAGSTPGSAGR